MRNRFVFAFYPLALSFLRRTFHEILSNQHVLSHAFLDRGNQGTYRMRWCSAQQDKIASLLQVAIARASNWCSVLLANATMRTNPWHAEAAWSSLWTEIWQWIQCIFFRGEIVHHVNINSHELMGSMCCISRSWQLPYKASLQGCNST